MLTNILILAIALGIVAGLVILRGKSDGKFDAKPTDVLIAVSFVILWMFMSGHIEKMVVGGEGVTLQTSDAILKASKQNITDAVSLVSLTGAFAVARHDAEKTVSEAVANRAKALEYQLGVNRYSADAIRRELDVLTQYVFFEYVVLSNVDGSLFGVINAHKLVRILAREPGPYSWEDFVSFINEAKPEDLEALRGVPSFVDGKLAVTDRLSKDEVLTRMGKTQRNWLPIVSENRRFLGVVSQSQLTASMILDVTKRLSGKAK